MRKMKELGYFSSLKPLSDLTEVSRPSICRILNEGLLLFMCQQNLLPIRSKVLMRYLEFDSRSHSELQTKYLPASNTQWDRSRLKHI